MTVRSAAVCVLAALFLVPAANAQSPVRTISVTGEGSFRAANDTARVGFGVVARGATRPAALRGSSARLRRVLAAIRELDAWARTYTGSRLQAASAR